jgi:hypothetical protein
MISDHLVDRKWHQFHQLIVCLDPTMIGNDEIVIHCTTSATMCELCQGEIKALAALAFSIVE